MHVFASPKYKLQKRKKEKKKKIHNKKIQGNKKKTFRARRM